MRSLVDRAIPAQLGPDARRFLGATWLVQATDGIALVAGPLAVASLTGAPLLVALVVALHRLPVLLLGPAAALLADLVNRRTVLVLADAARVVLLLLLALLLALGAAPVALVLLTMTALGALETVTDSVRGPVLEMIVPAPDSRSAALDRVDAGFVVGTQLAGPALGALAFTLGRAVPFALEAALLAGAVALLSGLRLAGPARGASPSGVRRPLRAGLRRIVVDPTLSALVLCGMAAQASWAAGWSLLVVLADKQLDLGPLGFGLLVVAGAAGGMVGVLLRPAMDRLGGQFGGRIRPMHLVLAGFALEACGHAGLALTTGPLLAGAVVAALGLVGFLAGSLARDQRLALAAADGTADELNAAVAKLGLAATIAGCLVGGVAASAGGIAAAYWSGAALLGISVLLLGRRMLAVPSRPAYRADVAL